MKKMLLMAGLLVCSLATFAYEPASNDGSMLLAQYNNREQVVRAYYVSNGQLASIKIKINGSYVVAYSTGKDYVGNENWHNVQTPASITRTNSTFDGEMAREFNQKATLHISNGYNTSSLTVYF